MFMENIYIGTKESVLARARPLELFGAMVPQNFDLEIYTHVDALNVLEVARELGWAAACFHVHTQFSLTGPVSQADPMMRYVEPALIRAGFRVADAALVPEGIVETAHAFGLSHVGISDHDTYAGSIIAHAYASSNGYPVFIVPGIEYSTGFGHGLVYGGDLSLITKEYSYFNMIGSEEMDPDFLRWVAAHNGLIIAGHPLDPRVPWTDFGVFSSQNIGFETYNPGCAHNPVHETGGHFSRYLPEHRVHLTGADAHFDPSEMLTAFMLFPDIDRSERDLIGEIRSRGTRGIHVYQRQHNIVRPLWAKVDQIIRLQAQVNDMTVPEYVRSAGPVIAKAYTKEYLPDHISMRSLKRLAALGVGGMFSFRLLSMLQRGQSEQLVYEDAD